MSTTFRLRPWQRAAFDRFQASSESDYLAVATPGAGKTTFALTCARWVLGQRRCRVAVVAPTSHLKTQWAQAAHRLGLALDPNWTPGTGLARDVHGLVTTYQQISTGDAALKLRALMADGFVILDEIHHAGDERAWGDGVRTAFELAHRRLAVSGTPFRSDTAAIPFVRYQAEEAVPDYEYGYADALRDGGVVRPVYFPRIDGLMEWTAPDGTLEAATFDDSLDAARSSQRLRTALSLDGEWLPHVLGQAHERLMQIRVSHPEAGGLVIAIDLDHAKSIARVLRDRFGSHPVVVTSDDPLASAKIAEFAADSKPWLVAVRMVSEGVDIPRLRVGVYATTTTTELFFRQAVGRFVRWSAGRRSQKAYVFLPDDPRLRSHAFQIADARRHVLRSRTEDLDEEFRREQDPDEAAAQLDSMSDEQLSLFSVVSAVATDMELHAFTETGLSFDDEPDLPEPEYDDEALAALAIDLPDVPTEAGMVRTDELSVAERKDELRARNADLARKLVDLTGWTHAKVNGELNRLAGVNAVASATSDQLERRIRYGESWARKIRAQAPTTARRSG
ncbi:MAG: DEAD/DEAH box helicase [Ilumatobacteraceae bacterium]